jgi:hypothetical protein
MLVAMRRWRSHTLLALGALALALACGGRDAPRLSFVDGAGGDGADGDVGASSGVGGSAGRGTTSSGVGGAATCEAPACECGSCLASCSCAGIDASACARRCSGGQGGATTSGSSVASVTTTSTSVGAGGIGQGGVAGSGAAPSTTGSGGTGGVGECVAQARDRCGACACTDCFGTLGACIADFGCPVLLACFERTGCSGLECYRPSTCRDVIDSYGGLTGDSMLHAIGLGLCTVRAGCPC